MSAIERLLERLQTGWTPTRDEIDRDIRQVDLHRWVMFDGVFEGRLRNFLAGFDQAEASTAFGTGPVIFWGPNMNWALTTTCFCWLDTP